MVATTPTISDGLLAAFCQRHSIRALWLFGSVLRDDFSPESDIDVLVEFEAGREPSLLGFARMQIELSQAFGREVHLHTPAMLSPRSRDQIRTNTSLRCAA